MKMQPNDTPVDSLCLGELVSNPRGGKTCNFAKPVKLMLKECSTPFEVSSYDGISDRKTLDLRSTREIRDFCKRLDEQLKKQGSNIACKPDGYRSLLKDQKEGYDELFRTKLTLSSSGKTNVKIFDENKQRLSEEQIAGITWRDCVMTVLVSIKGCYVHLPMSRPL